MEDGKVERGKGGRVEGKKVERWKVGKVERWKVERWKGGRWKGGKVERCTILFKYISKRMFSIEYMHFEFLSVLIDHMYISNRSEYIF